MEITNGKITQITEEELFDYWLNRFEEAYNYNDFKAAIKEHGTKIIEGEDN